MEPIKEGQTWRQIQSMFDKDDEFSLSIQPQARRLKPWKRKKGEKDDRKVLRLIVQRRRSSDTKTVLRKNLREASDNYLERPPTPKLVAQINGIVAGAAAVR